MGADKTLMDRRAVERETTDRLSKMMSQQSVEAPSFDTLQSLASEEGHVEAYPLARDSSSGRHVSLYIDGIGALRERPRNARAEKLCAACGLHGLSIRGGARSSFRLVRGVAAEPPRPVPGHAARGRQE